MRVDWIPLLIFPCLIIGILISYTVAGVSGHTDWCFPSISVIGTRSPESCIFGQFMNVGAVLITVRSLAVRKYRELHEISFFVRFSNYLTFWMGLACGIGFMIMANFQIEPYWFIHGPGVLLAVGGSLAVMFFATTTSYLLVPHESLKLARLQAVLFILAALTFFDYILLMLLMVQSRNENLVTVFLPKLKWSNNENGLILYIFASICQWVTLILFGIFSATFYPGFKKFNLAHPKVMFLSKNGPDLRNHQSL